MYEMKNGIRDGTAELFDDGILKLRWRMKSGVRDGSYVLFENGVAVMEGRWDDLGKEEERVILNHRSGLKMVILYNGTIIYEGGYNTEMEREGCGFEFENGVLKCYGKWEKDHLIELKQRFLSQSQMIEYADGSTSDLLSHRPVYVGGCQFDQTSGLMKRNGSGRVLNKDTGICEYESEWENGEETESKRVSLHDGWYHEHDSNEPIISFPSISSPFTIEELTIGDDNLCDPTVSTLQLSHLPTLKTIQIGDNCGLSIHTVLLEFLDSLQLLTIGKHAFTTCKSNWPIEHSNRTFTINHCSRLEFIHIGESTFSDYSSFSLTDLPALSSLSLQSHSFIFAPDFSLTSSFCFIVDRRFAETEIGSIGSLLFLFLSLHLFSESLLLSLFIRSPASSVHFPPVGSSTWRRQKGQETNRFPTLRFCKLTPHEMCSFTIPFN